MPIERGQTAGREAMHIGGIIRCFAALALGEIARGGGKAGS